jgi:hypothetical protein
MNDADRVARELAHAQQDAQPQRDQEQHEEVQPSDLLTEIGSLTEPALNAQKAAGYPALETVELRGHGKQQRDGYRLTKSWMKDRGSAIVAIDYLLADGTFASSYENRPLVPIDWDNMSVSRLRGIRDGVQRLSSPG